MLNAAYGIDPHELRPALVNWQSEDSNEGRYSIPVILVLSQGGIIWVICGSLCNSRMRRRTSIFGIKCSLKINTRPVSNDIHAIQLYIYDACHDNKVLSNIVSGAIYDANYHYPKVKLGPNKIF